MARIGQERRLRLASVATSRALLAAAGAVLAGGPGPARPHHHQDDGNPFGGGFMVGGSFIAPFRLFPYGPMVLPMDGVVDAEVRSFSRRIGGTSWDETMFPMTDPFINFMVLFQSGRVIGLAGDITPYDPGHADFGLLLPASR